MKRLNDEAENPDDPDDGEPLEMGFMDHLEEMRGVLLKCGLAFFGVVTLLAFFLGSAADVLAWPLMRAQAAHGSEMLGLVTRRPFDVFTVILQVLFFGGFFLSLPAMLYFVAGFLAPGLTRKEKKMLLPGMVAVFFLFLFGAGFAYLVILPITLQVAMHLNQVLGYELLWTASDYYGLVVWVSILLGALFQFPLILIILIYVELIRTEQLKRHRRMVFVGTLILGALIVPTGDPLTFIFIALPMFGLYLLAIKVGEIVERRLRREREAMLVEDDVV